jgi:hypothetical protein
MYPTDDRRARAKGLVSGAETHSETIRLARKVMRKLGPPAARREKDGGLSLIQIPGDPASEATSRPAASPVARWRRGSGSCWLVVTFEGAVPKSRGLFMIAPNDVEGPAECRRAGSRPTSDSTRRTNGPDLRLAPNHAALSAAR